MFGSIFSSASSAGGHLSPRLVDHGRHAVVERDRAAGAHDQRAAIYRQPPQQGRPPTDNKGFGSVAWSAPIEPIARRELSIKVALELIAGTRSSTGGSYGDRAANASFTPNSGPSAGVCNHVSRC